MRLLVIAFAFLNFAICAHFSGFSNGYNLMFSQDPMTEEHFCAMLNLNTDCLANTLFSAVPPSLIEILGEKRGKERAGLVLNILSLLKTANVTFGTSELDMAVQVCKADLHQLLDKQRPNLLRQKAADRIDYLDSKNRQREYLHLLADYQLIAVSDALRARLPDLASLHVKAAAEIIDEIYNIKY